MQFTALFRLSILFGFFYNQVDPIEIKDYKGGQ